MDLPENALQRAVILDFRPRLENHYKVFLGISPNAAVILDFRPRLGNRCMVLPENDLGSAVILDLRGAIWESLHGFAWKRPRFCSDS